jgi:hypothetical protein
MKKERRRTGAAPSCPSASLSESESKLTFVRRYLALAAAIATAAAIPVLQASPTSAASNGAWSVFPTSQPGQILGRAYFQLSLVPGENYRDSVSVINQTTNSLQFNLYAADAYNTADGGFALHRRTDPKRDIGAWIQLPTEVLNIPARTQALIPFTVSVPPDASPGDHPGGIVAESTQGTTTRRGSLGITVLQAVGTRAYGRVAGPLDPSFTIANFSVHAHRGFVGLLGGPVSADVQYTLVNTGNVILDPATVASMSPLIGSSTGLRSVNIPALLPHDSATIHQHVNSLYPILRLSSSLRVTATGYGVTRMETVSTLVIPWLAFVIILLTLVAIFLYRRLKRAGLGVPEKPEKPPEKAIRV